MAVRVRLRLSAGSRVVETGAVLNGGFEVPRPHLLLPEACADQLLGRRWRSGRLRPMTAAGGTVDLYAPARRVTGRVVTTNRQGRSVSFEVLVSKADDEVLVSDGGIDALGIEIKSFVPGRWRFADEKRIRDAEVPQRW